MYRQETSRMEETMVREERVVVIVNARSYRCKPYALCNQGLLQVVNK